MGGRLLQKPGLDRRGRSFRSGISLGLPAPNRGYGAEVPPLVFVRAGQGPAQRILSKIGIT